jgi:uncharacterized protein YgiM (DUF1202 family)
MRIYVLLLLMVASSAIGADAQSSFDSKDYTSAARELEQQLASSPPSAETYYNLGLANERAGNVPQAALNYERAVYLDPGLRPARNALASLAGLHGFPIPPHSWKSDVSALAHPDTLVGAGVALIWAGAFGLLFATQVNRRRSLTNALSVIALLVGGATLASGWLVDARMATRLPAMVHVKGGTEMLSAPANNSAPVASLPAGAPVDVLSPRGVWSHVKLDGGTRGWVHTESLTPLIPGENL